MRFRENVGSRPAPCAPSTSMIVRDASLESRIATTILESLVPGQGDPLTLSFYGLTMARIIEVCVDEARGSSPARREGDSAMVTAVLARQQQSSVWWLALLQGIAAILLGLMLLSAPGATILALMTFLGFYWLITGVLSLVRVFVDRSTGLVWALLTGIIGILAGIFVLNHPLLAAVTVPTVLIVILGLEGLIMGAFEIFRGFSGGGVGAFILGVFHVLIGLLLLGRPMAAALAVPLVFGVLLLIEGVGLMIWAIRVRA